MKYLLLRSSLRYLRSHYWQTALSVLGVALGVALVVGVDAANAAARRAFTLSIEGVSGKATHQVVPASGTLPDSLYRRLRVDYGIRPAAPAVEDYVQSDALPGQSLRLLGIDPFAEGPFRPYIGAGIGDTVRLPLGQLLTQPRTAVLAASLARDLGVRVGDSLTVQHNGVLVRLRAIGVLNPADETTARAVDGLILTDIATAQEVLGLLGRLSRIDLILPTNSPARRDSAEATLRRLLPPAAQLERAAARARRLDEMTAAFRLNLTALGLLALVVGVLLVYNTVTFSVVQRTAYLGLLRALGVTQGGVARVVLREALLLGVLGAGLGLVLGYFLAQALTQLVSRSINDLYFVLQVRDAAPTADVFVKGLLVGLLATLAGAAAPARAAARTQPRATLQRSAWEDRLHRSLPRLGLLGAAAALLGVGLLVLSGSNVAASYLGLLALLTAFALWVPALTLWLMRALRPLVQRLFGLMGGMAARDVVAHLSRTAVAIAALSIAVAATIGVGVMVSSFRTTVQVWLRGALQSDVYVSPPSPVARRNDATLAPGVVDAIRRTPGVASVGTIRAVLLDYRDRQVQLVALGGLDSASGQRFQMQSGTDDEGALARLAAGEAIVSEPFAYRFGLGPGDTLRLPTDVGARAFRIAGVFYDYGSDLGIVHLSEATYHRFWRDRGTSGLAVRLAPGQDADTVMAQMRTRTAGFGQTLLIRSNRSLLDTSLAVFDRTFAITGALRLLTVLVAFVGVLSALMALLLERARELAVLRAVGLTPRQVGVLAVLQTGLMGLVAGLAAIPVGLGLAWALVYVINRRSFGWTLQFDLSPALLLQGLALAVLAAVLAGLYPAWRMSRSQPAAALRDE